MLKKKISIGFITIIFLIITIFFAPSGKTYKVLEVKTPTLLKLENGDFEIKSLDCFKPEFCEYNTSLAKKMGISEEEAFAIGNLAKYWAEDLIKNRNVAIKNNSDLTHLKFSYTTKFLYSGFCIKDNKPVNQRLFNHKLNDIRKGKFIVFDLNSNNFYKITDEEVRSLKRFLLVRKSVKYNFNKKNKISETKSIKTKISKGDIKILLSDSTINLKPQKTCSDTICKEILNNINNTKNTIDMAIYGYSGVPEIETAFKNAIQRGVKIRLVYDADSTGANIYENTENLKQILKNNISDKNSPEAGNLMHNKFYIFDNTTLITGSANLSYTDMSGYNSNSIIIVKNPQMVQLYKTEFEQMFSGKFHSQKSQSKTHRIEADEITLDVYFSPQDKTISNTVLPLIQNAKNYIYIPTFVLTHPAVTEELINAKKRGVDVKILIDALNASGKYSKHPILRQGGVEVKTENYAGKMHSKSMIVDDKYTIIGSMNFSNSGDKRNDENLVVIHNTEITKFYKEFFLYQWNKIDDKWLKYNARAEGKDSIGSCEDGLDNNYDGLVDMADPACSNKS